MMEVVPRTRTELSMAMRSEPSLVTFTPAALPLKASRALLSTPFLVKSDSTILAALGTVSESKETGITRCAKRVSGATPQRADSE